MTALTDLNAALVVMTGAYSFAPTSSFAAADGVTFLCPRCVALFGASASHSVAAWSSTGAAPAGLAPPGTRWRMYGTGVADLTLVADPPRDDVFLRSACTWQGQVVNGSAL